MQLAHLFTYSAAQFLPSVSFEHFNKGRSQYLPVQNIIEDKGPREQDLAKGWRVVEKTYRDNVIPWKLRWLLAWLAAAN